MPAPPRTLLLETGTVDFVRREFVVGEELRSLTAKECELLAFLAERPGEPVSREALLEHVWGYAAGAETRTVDVTVRRLRQKIEVNPEHPRHVLTQHGSGYRFEPPAVATKAAESAPEPTPEKAAVPAAGPALDAEDVCLVFTDVVGSTRLWEQHGPSFQACLNRHDDAVRAEIAKHRGYEVKTVGDAFVVAFARPADAVRFALGTHRALAATQWQAFLPMVVRIGIHSGECSSKADPVTGRRDWFGGVPNRAARVCRAAHGGQVLTTGVVQYLAADTATWTDLGEHGLEGIGGTVRLWQADPLGEAASFPAPRTARSTRLPTRADRFIGRVAELSDIFARFRGGARLVTLLSPGGTGKTRLALQYATEAGNSSWADLVEARTADAVLGAVCAALGVPVGKGTSDQIGHALAARGQALLVLDNIEQVADVLGEHVGRWLARAPRASILTTGRVALHVEGEQVLDLGPLDDKAAIELFTDRAKAAASAFAASASDVKQLVRELDRWPLALELAAARTRAVTVPELRRRLKKRFSVLTGGRDRHSTLRNVIEGSWDALNDAERSTLAQLSVFAGGFTIDAAESVVALTAPGPVERKGLPSAFRSKVQPDALTAVQGLVDHALVRLDHTTGRYHMLVTVRAFAEEQLADNGAAAARHMAWCANLGDEPPESERDNLLAAARRAIETKNAGLAAVCARLAAILVQRTGPFREAAELAAAALEIAPPSERPALYLHCGRLLQLVGEIAEAESMLRLAERSPATCKPARVCLATLARQQGRLDEAFALLVEVKAEDPEVAPAALEELTQSLIASGRYTEAQLAARASLTAARKADDDYLTGRALVNLALLASVVGDVREANTAFARARAEVCDARNEASLEHAWGIFALERGELEAAIQHFELGLSMHREAGARRPEGIGLANLGCALGLLGRYDESVRTLEQALLVQREIGDVRSEGCTLSYLALAELGLGRTESALASALGAVERTTLALDDSGMAEAYAQLADAYLAQRRLPEAKVALVEAWDCVRKSGRGPMRAEILARRAQIEAAAGDAPAAQRFLAEAEALVAAAPPGARSSVGAALSRARAAVGV